MLQCAAVCRVGGCAGLKKWRKSCTGGLLFGLVVSGWPGCMFQDVVAPALYVLQGNGQACSRQLGTCGVVEPQKRVALYTIHAQQRCEEVAPVFHHWSGCCMHALGGAVSEAHVFKTLVAGQSATQARVSTVGTVITLLVRRGAFNHSSYANVDCHACCVLVAWLYCRLRQPCLLAGCPEVERLMLRCCVLSGQRVDAVYLQSHCVPSCVVPSRVCSSAITGRST